MSYPNSALSAWQLAMIAVVMVASLTTWLLLVYLAAREPRKRDVRSWAAPEPATLPRSEEPAKPERKAVA